MPFIDILIPFAEYVMHWTVGVGKFYNEKSVAGFDETYISEVCLVAFKNGGLRGS